jgi:hypothetical protein
MIGIFMPVNDNFIGKRFPNSKDGNLFDSRYRGWVHFFSNSSSVMFESNHRSQPNGATA